MESAGKAFLSFYFSRNLKRGKEVGIGYKGIRAMVFGFMIFSFFESTINCCKAIQFLIPDKLIPYILYRVTVQAENNLRKKSYFPLKRRAVLTGECSEKPTERDELPKIFDIFLL